MKCAEVAVVFFCVAVTVDRAASSSAASSLAEFRATFPLSASTLRHKQPFPVALVFLVVVAVVLMLSVALQWVFSFIEEAADDLNSEWPGDELKPSPTVANLQEWGDHSDGSATLQCGLELSYEESGKAGGTEEIVARYLESAAKRRSGTAKGKRGDVLWSEPVTSGRLADGGASTPWQRFSQVAASALGLTLDEASQPATDCARETPAGACLPPESLVWQTSKEAEAQAEAGTQAAPVNARSALSASPVISSSGFLPGFGLGSLTLLPPKVASRAGKKTLVLDLDETLVHSVFQPVPRPDYFLRVELEQGPMDVYVLKRPGVDDFLKAMAEKYEIVVFTASVKRYADPLLDMLDPQGLVTHRLFRDSCSSTCSSFVKDLSRLGRSLADTIIVDNSPSAYAFHPENALPILSFYDDMADRELDKLTPLLESLADTPGDVRSLLNATLGSCAKRIFDSHLGLHF